MPQSRTRKIVVTAVLAAITIVLGLLPLAVTSHSQAFQSPSWPSPSSSVPSWKVLL